MHLNIYFEENKLLVDDPKRASGFNCWSLEQPKFVSMSISIWIHIERKRGKEITWTDICVASMTIQHVIPTVTHPPSTCITRWLVNNMFSRMITEAEGQCRCHNTSLQTPRYFNLTNLVVRKKTQTDNVLMQFFTYLGNNTATAIAKNDKITTTIAIITTIQTASITTGI